MRTSNGNGRMNIAWIVRPCIRLGDLVNKCGRFPCPGVICSHCSRSRFCAPLPPATVIATALEMRADLLPTGHYNSIVPAWVRLSVRPPIIKGLPVALSRRLAPIGSAWKNRAPISCRPVARSGKISRCIKSVRQPKGGPKASSPWPPSTLAVSKLQWGARSEHGADLPATPEKLVPRVRCARAF